MCAVEEEDSDAISRDFDYCILIRKMIEIMTSSDRIFCFPSHVFDSKKMWRKTIRKFRSDRSVMFNVKDLEQEMKI